MVELNVVELIGNKPFGRYIEDYGSRSGEYFRIWYIKPHLMYGNLLHINLDGFNRYGRSFLMGAFHDLITVDGFEHKFVNNRLSYDHSKLWSYKVLIHSLLIEASHPK